MIRKTVFSCLLVLLTAALAGFVASCGGGGNSPDDGDDAEFRLGVPSPMAMSIDVPGDDNGGQLVLGERAELYTVTKGVSGYVNLYAGLVLATLRITVLLPPSERGEDFRVWGPTEPKGLEALSWRLRVERENDGLFTFSADAANKADLETFMPILTGSVTPGNALGESKGTMTLDYDMYQAVQGPDPCPTGSISLDWDASKETRTVTVRWDDFVNTCNGRELSNVTYEYSQNNDFSGSFLFQTQENIHLAGAGKPGDETLAMRSRWNGDGTGRSDVVLTSDEVATDLASAGLTGPNVQVTQCWDNLFNLTYSDTEPMEFEQFLFAEMGASGDCAFTEPDYPEF